MEANPSDSNVLLPPRKRLLACMKYRNGNGNVDSNSNPPSTNLLSAHTSDNNLSQLKIVEASRSAAEVAAKVAIAARAAAEKKAVLAAIAMAAAKKALELVAALNEQDTSSSSISKKNKRKKHVEVQMLYDNNNNNKNPSFENGKTSDEEVARQLHHVINSSPRISKHGSCDVNVDENPIKMNKFEDEKEKGIIGRKRGRMKQKKLPLSICHDRGQLNPNEDGRFRSSKSVENIERNKLWKCQAFNRLKQNKTIQS